MRAWAPEIACAYCGEPLPERGNKRVPIPRLHGRRRLVHAACAPEVERQTRLEVKP